jgi:hypothetical protein
MQDVLSVCFLAPLFPHKPGNGFFMQQKHFLCRKTVTNSQANFSAGFSKKYTSSTNK